MNNQSSANRFTKTQRFFYSLLFLALACGLFVAYCGITATHYWLSWIATILCIVLLVEASITKILPNPDFLKFKATLREAISNPHPLTDDQERRRFITRWWLVFAVVALGFVAYWGIIGNQWRWGISLGLCMAFFLAALFTILKGYPKTDSVNRKPSAKKKIPKGTLVSVQRVIDGNLRDGSPVAIWVYISVPYGRHHRHDTTRLLKAGEAVLNELLSRFDDCPAYEHVENHIRYGFEAEAKAMGIRGARISIHRIVGSRRRNSASDEGPDIGS